MKTRFSAIAIALFALFFIGSCSLFKDDSSRGGAAGAAIRELGTSGDEVSSED